MAKHRYLVALGSNQRHHRFGSPEAVLRAALAALDDKPCKLVAASRIMASRPLGPSLRRFANGAAIVKSRLDPDEMLDHLLGIERRFGRCRRGQRWRARVLDLDIVLWDGGAWATPGLVIPHPAFRARAFVLAPATAIAGQWRDPLTGLTLRHLHARLTRKPTPPN